MFGGRLGSLRGSLMVARQKPKDITSKPVMLQSEMSSISKLPIYQYTSEDLENNYIMLRLLYTLEDLKWDKTH